jgi:suppressor of tumorigenicity protein 13
MCFLREWVQSMGKISRNIKQNRTEENKKTMNHDEESDVEMDNEGVIDPDADGPKKWEMQI